MSFRSSITLPTGGISVVGSPSDTGQVLFAESTGPGTHAVTAYQADTTGTTNAAINAVSDNPNFSTLEVTGTETNRGTIKIAHKGYADGSDSSAAAISIDLQTTVGGSNGTDAQGLFITSTTGQTTGNLITARNNNRDDFVVKNTGTVGIRVPTGHIPAAALEIDQADDSTVGLTMTANSSSAQDMILLKDSTGATRYQINGSGNAVHRAISFFTTSVQIGSVSANLGGGSGVLGMMNAGAAPTSAPTGGGVLYVANGALHFMGANGTITNLAPA